MLPFYKLLSLFLRVFSRPLINLTKKHHAAHGIKNQFIKNIFFKLGNKFHQFEMFINRRYLKSDSKNPIRQLSQPLAIDKGIQFFYQIIFYSIAIGFPTYQLIRAAKDTKKKQQKLKNRVDYLKNKIKLIEDNKKKIENQVKINHHISLYTYQLISKNLIVSFINRYTIYSNAIKMYESKKSNDRYNSGILINGRSKQLLIDFMF